MTTRIPIPAALAALAGALMIPMAAPADEGMWLFNRPPTALLKERHGFEPTPQWLEHVQKSAVRFNSGGSGSFVSPDGLVLTNHHVGADALQKLSTPQKNYLADGFHAKTRDQEVKCVDLELNVLQSIEDVTARVNAAVKDNMTPEQAFGARRKAMAEIEKESNEKTGLRSDVVTLFQGGEYHLYRFKRYTDVRLVFAPEKQIAFFGGDPDNFEYPRYDLDMCIFRVYENGQPIKPEQYLKWSPHGSSENELVFVPGHPGRTNRQNTVAELEYLRDLGYPYLLQRLFRWEVNLRVFSDRTAENARQAEEELFGIENSRKARIGGLAGLLDPELMGRKKTAEQKLRSQLQADPAKYKEALAAFETIAAAEKKRAALIKPYTVLEAGAGFNSTLFGIARTLLRAAEEKPKPSGERLREFGDARLPSLELQLFSEEPIYDTLETVKLADGLTFLAGQFGAENALVRQVLAGKSPRERAAELVRGSKLKDVSLRKKLYEGGKSAVDASDDPMIALAKLVDPEARAVRKQMETDVEEVKRQAHAQIEKARYAIEGGGTYPDATFTLRLAFGVVKGYEEEGRVVPAFTYFAGLFERSKEHNNQPPFNLPPRWVERKDKLDLKTPFNFVSTADIIGGNSGSPVVNKNAELVGLIFDGNIQSLVLDFIYTEDQARAVSVDSRAIIEALRKVYDANELADELTGGKKPAE
jgi:hypothetical protein